MAILSIVQNRILRPRTSNTSRCLFKYDFLFPLKFWRHEPSQVRKASKVFTWIKSKSFEWMDFWSLLTTRWLLLKIFWRIYLMKYKKFWKIEQYGKVWPNNRPRLKYNWYQYTRKKGPVNLFQTVRFKSLPSIFFNLLCIPGQ